MMRKAVFTIAAATLIVACGGGKKSSGGGAPIAGCDDGGGACGYGAGIDATYCASNVGGTWLPAGCPAANQVGTCTALATTPGIWILYSPDYTATTGASVCSSEGGTWSAAGGGGGGGTSTTMRCLWSGDMCDQVTAVVTSADITALQTSCTGDGGSFATAACSTTGAVSGNCYYASLNIGVTGATAHEYYYTASWTLADAQAWCAAPPAGVWQY